MFPAICKGDTITVELQNEYKDGDILYFIEKDKPKELKVRQFVFLDNKILTIAYNINDFKSLVSGYSLKTLFKFLVKLNSV